MGQVFTGNEQFETHIEADYRGKILQKGPDSGDVDAFGRARVSEPFTLFDSTLRHADNLALWHQTLVGTGASSHSVNESSILMTVTASGDSVLRRTKRRFPYQPGKSLTVLQSFAGATPAAGLTQELGLFDDHNGVMVRASGTTIQFVIRSYTEGGVNETIVNQSDWNIDTFPSLDFSKSNIFVTDLEWLGVGRVRVGFIIDGEHRYCHEFNHANTLSKVYMSTAVLPLTYRLTATATASGTMRQICSSVMSEGGYEPAGPIYLAGRGVNNFSAIHGETLVAAIRMASGRTDNVILPAQIDAALGGAPGSNVVAEWRLRLNPTINGAWVAADNGRGNVETMASGTFSGGTVVGAGLVTGRSEVEFELKSGLALSLGTNASGVSDVLALTIQCSMSHDATGLIGWKEVL